MNKPSYVDFDETKYKWDPSVDYKKNPHLYRIGRGQQGVLICQPYKDEICQYWEFKNPDIAERSAQRIYEMFMNYLEDGDFVGADMAKKYLHMGFTRSRRYANHSSGRKWQKQGDDWSVLPQESDWATNEKAISANIFKDYWKMARENERYLEMKTIHREKYERFNKF